MPRAIDYSKFRIVPDTDTQGWWEGIKQHKVLVRHCPQCDHRFFPPYPACPGCGSMELDYMETGNKGVIFSYIAVAQPIQAAFVNTVPYVVALIELPGVAGANGQAVRIGGVMLEEEDEIAIGLPVEPVFEDPPDGGLRMPRWRVTGKAKNTWQWKAALLEK